MSTRTVRFDFISAIAHWKHTHEITTRLLTDCSTQAEINSFREYFLPLIDQFRPECNSYRVPTCAQCHKPSINCMVHPVSSLNHAPDPHVKFAVMATCGHKDCRREAQMKAARDLRPHGIPMQTDDDTCVVCGSKEDVLQCGNCKGVSYCGKIHQKLDWKVHKSRCRPLETARDVFRCSVWNCWTFFHDLSQAAGISIPARTVRLRPSFHVTFTRSILSEYQCRFNSPPHVTLLYGPHEYNTA